MTGYMAPEVVDGGPVGERADLYSLGATIYEMCQGYPGWTSFVDGTRCLRDREAIDVALDLFAVGVILYELLCDGQHPYPNARPMVDEPVIDPRKLRPDLKPGLAEFLIKACAPAKADRFATAAEMRDALREIRDEM
jgi:serine/threonine protein kinase